MNMKWDDNGSLTAVSSWIDMLNQVYTREDSARLYEMVKNMSSSEATAFFNKLNTLCMDDDSLRFFSYVYEEQQKDDYNPENRMFSHLPNFSKIRSSNFDMDKLSKLLADEWPERRFTLDLSVFQKMFGLWQLDDDHRYLHHVPSDLLFMRSIVYTDIEFVIKDLIPDNLDFTPIVRVKVMDQFRIGASQDDVSSTSTSTTTESDQDFNVYDVVPSGIISFSLNKEDTKGMIVSFGIQYGLDIVLLYDSVQFYGITPGDVRTSDGVLCFDDAKFIQICTTFLQIWYTIQVFACNERLREVFEPFGKIKDRRKRLSGFLCRKIGRLLLSSDITEEKLADVLERYDLQKNVNINYLVGGWEQILDTMVFVNGHWHECIPGADDVYFYKNWKHIWKEIRLLAAQRYYEQPDKELWTSDILKELINEK